MRSFPVSAQSVRGRRADLSFRVAGTALMTVAIMGDLTLATVLTLLAVPVLYAVMFRIPSSSTAS